MGNQSGSDRGGLFHRTDLLAVYAQRQETPESTGKTHSTKGILKENYRRISHYGNITFEIFSNFVGGQLMDACILGLLCFIGMSIFHFQYPLLISVIIGLTNMIPIVKQLSAPFPVH